MNPANGPKARLLQRESPPSSGYRDERKTTVIESGANIARPPMIHTESELAPAAAAAATHCKFVEATTKKRMTSSNPNVFLRCMAARFPRADGVRPPPFDCAPRATGCQGRWAI